MLRPAHARTLLAQRLRAAYADGLLSEATLNQRLDRVLSPGVIDARSVVGDLALRRASRPFATTALLRERVRRWLTHEEEAPAEPRPLLALDWSGATSEILLGRHSSCDVVLASDDVSRRHARVFFRDGHWIVQDLESTNGTLVNGARVGRCRLRPGDVLRLGTEELLID